ncbi:MAG: hypothetical protein AB7U73_17525 [Pirellulales bacterium]
MSATQLSHRDPPPIAVLPLALRGRELWHRSAPAALRAGEFEHEKQAWKLWRRHLARRRSSPSRTETNWLEPTNGSSLNQAGSLAAISIDRTSDACPAESVDPRTLVGKPRRLEAQCRQWLARSSDRVHDPRAALEALAWAYALPRIAEDLSGDAWWQVLDQLIELAGGHNRAHRYNGLVGQLLSTELTLVLAHQFPEIKPCRWLAKRSGPALEAGLTEMLAADGMPRPASLAEMPRLFACWLRASELARHFKRNPWPDACRERLGHGLRQVSRLLDDRGYQFVPGCDRVPWPRSLWKSCVHEFGDRRDRQVLKYQQSKPRRLQSADNRKRLPEPAAQSDSACVAVLRGSWSPRDVTLAVEHAARTVQLELNVAREPLLAGQWQCDVVVDGTPRQAVTGWEANCWETDRDVAYLELEASFTGDVRVFRQMLVAREEQFVLLADVVVARQATAIAYQGRLPLANGASTMPIADHTEVELFAGQRSFTVLPLALPEWRRECAGLELTGNAAELQLSQTAAGRALYAPLLLDLDARRTKRPYTWRRLTIAENRRTVSADEAAGFRVQRGQQQWLFYRALSQRAGRTVLGVHLWSEFLASKFDHEGESHPLIEVE